jgi:photosystem II stability/assembly factor-like uncharacterized protein
MRVTKFRVLFALVGTLATALAYSHTPPVSFKAELEPAEGPPPLWDNGSYLDADHAWIGLVKTSDGGKTWQRVRVPKEVMPALGVDPSRWSDPDYREFAYDEQLGHTKFISWEHGWLYVMYGKIGLWETMDGGLTWVKAPTEDFAWSVFLNAKDGWVLLGSDEGSTYQNYITRDGGKTWQACGPLVRERFYDLRNPYFLTAKLGWAFTSHWTGAKAEEGLARTEDGGCTWKTIWTASGNMRRVTDGEIFFLDKDEGWIVPLTAGGLFHTVNGGVSWEPVAVPGASDEKFDSVFFQSHGEGWLTAPSCEDEKLYETVDGGRSWTQVEKGKVVDVLTGATRSGKWKRGGLLLMVLRSLRHQV